MTKIKIFLATLTVIFMAVAMAQTHKSQKHRDWFADDLPSYKWMQNEWTATDTPYLKMQGNLDSTLSKAKPEEVVRLLSGYQKEAELHPKDAQKQFKWAYSVYKAAKNGYYRRSMRGDAQDLSFALDEAKSPHSYAYARLRFLLAMRWKGEAFKLKPLAQRLLKRNSNDYEVLYAACNTLQTRTSAPERKQALIYTKRLAKLRPQAANSLRCFGERLH